MTVREIRLYPDPVLRTVCAPVDRIEVWHLEDPRASIFALFS